MIEVRNQYILVDLISDKCNKCEEEHYKNNSGKVLHISGILSIEIKGRKTERRRLLPSPRLPALLHETGLWAREA